MLKKILSISGKPGLYRLISYGKGIIIVENVTDNKRMPAYTRDKIIALGDIAIYTDDTEVPLADVLTTIAEKYNSQVLDTKLYKSAAQLQQFFEEVLPNYDHDRVYNTDIKKIISWYNTLISAGITDFSIKSEEESAKQENE
ncbi:MAG: DUF5606 domain-containing protein [Muribaculaceae bacterium]|nr:DUF5606 domain-containing protein [Muribaculaceae bacterium]